MTTPLVELEEAPERPVSPRPARAVPWAAAVAAAGYHATYRALEWWNAGRLYVG